MEFNVGHKTCISNFISNLRNAFASVHNNKATSVCHSTFSFVFVGKNCPFSKMCAQVINKSRVRVRKEVGA